MRARIAAPCWIFLLAAASLISSALAGDADEDWKKIVALDAGPGIEMKSREQARTVTLQHLALQEKTLRDFLQNHRIDARAFDAQLRLAHLLAVRGDLEPNAKAAAEAVKTLEVLEKSAPEERRADVAFAKIALAMGRVREPDNTTRESLMARVNLFQKQFPTDRRVPRILVEMAALHDSLPAKKKQLLEQAKTMATDEELKRRIDDDLKRLEKLGKPLALKFTSIQGREADLETYRGKVVLIYFFGNFSPPSMAGLATIASLAQKYSAQELQTIGINLDEDREITLAIIKKHRIEWPVACDGKGWESPLVRSLGINALPTAWLVDRRGVLRKLNARTGTEAAIRELLSEEKRR